MISDKERRRVAKALREPSELLNIRVPIYEALDMPPDVAETLVSSEGVEHNNRRLLNRLADLIDRPTCTEVEVTKEEGECGPTIFHHELSCGHTCDTGWSKPPKYCNECGARIIEVDDGE